MWRLRSRMARSPFRRAPDPGEVSGSCGTAREDTRPPLFRERSGVLQPPHRIQDLAAVFTVAKADRYDGRLSDYLTSQARAMLPFFLTANPRLRRSANGADQCEKKSCIGRPRWPSFRKRYYLSRRNRMETEAV